MASYQEKEGWRVRSRGKATQCSRNGIAGVARKWRDERRGAEARLIPEEFALHCGRIGAGNKAGREKGDRRSDQEENCRWSLDAFMVCVRANMEDPVWVSEVLGEGTWGVTLENGSRAPWCRGGE